MNSILEPTNWPEGIKKTKQRVGIWQVLSQAQKPITAAEIATGLGEDGGSNSVWMSTIYRTLDFLVEKQLVTRTVLSNSDMALYEITPHQHRHYAVCTECHRMIPLHNCPVVSTPHDLEDTGFEVTGHNLEIYGVCSECQKHHK